MERSSNMPSLFSQVLMCDVSMLFEPVLVVFLVLQHLFDLHGNCFYI